jgi:2-polyprenyl-6-methoxyphenol hydroxylase-like FAD-dependent oxidoreductase
MAENFDVVIIGGGPGGYAAALYGASAGLNIALVAPASTLAVSPPRNFSKLHQFAVRSKVLRPLVSRLLNPCSISP